jgi:hypothetical protein
MAYSRKRLALIALGWIAFGLLLGGGLFTGVTANPNCPDGTSDGTSPCDFPADNYGGGIVLGTPSLNGNQLVLFQDETANNVFNGISSDFGRDTNTNCDNQASGVDTACQDTVTVGFNVNEVGGLFLYKTWKTKDDRDVPTDSQAESGNYDDVYVWITSGQGTLEGPDAERNDVSCKETDSNNQLNPHHCDLTAQLTEVAFSDVTLDATVESNVFTTDVNDDALSPALDSDPSNGYWVNDPGADADPDNGCSVSLDTLSIGGLSPDDVNLGAFCLGFVDPTFPERDASDLICFFGACVTVNDFTINTLILHDLMVKGPAYFAVPPDDVSPSGTRDLNKDLVLENAPGDDAGDPGFYAEIRWGKGHDRALFPASDRADNGNAEPDPEQHVFGGPAPANSDNPGLTGPDVSGLAHTFPCTGNPTSGDDFEDQSGRTVGDTTCDRDPENRGTPQAGPYDDVYR